MNKIIKLPEPNLNHSLPLMKALAQRRTKRRWRDANLSEQELSDILWAACGVTQTETKRSKSKRTVPSARNSQTIKVYLAISDGVFLYNETNHELIQITEDDLRKNVTNQKMMQNAPAALIFVSDFSKLKGYVGTDDGRKWFVAGTETGYISQNVYLYCAAANLNTAVIGLVNREKLQELMHLNDFEKVIYTQAIGKKHKL